jgi:hypothetical protein
MLLSEFFSHLSYGELAQYNIGTVNNGKITDKDYPRLISFVNLGLTKMHTKLALRMEQVVIEVTGGQSKYILNRNFAVSNAASSENKYILDSHSPFGDNILVIESICNEKGKYYSLNDYEDEETIYTPSASTIQFSQPKYELVSLVYRANHPKIAMSRSTVPEDVMLELPENLIEALLNYVIARLISSGGNAESAQEGLLFMQKFELELQQTKQAGLIHADAPTNNRIWRDGWV